MNRRILGNALGALALLAAGCGDTTSTDMAPAKDMSIPPDMTAAPDMAVAPDMTMVGAADMTIVYSPTLIVEELLTTVPGMGIPARTIAAIIINPDPALARKSDYDDTVPPGLGCSANHYMVGGGDDPTPDIDLGTVTLSGYPPMPPLGQMMAVPAEINCVMVAGSYQCGYGPLNAGMPSMQNTNLTFFSPASPLIPAPTPIVFKYTGGAKLGMFDSKDAAKASDSLTVMEDLTKIVYDPSKDTVIHYTCDNKPMNCFDAVLVQIVASSVLPGMQGYPGADYGTINCAALGGGQVTIKKEAIAAMFGNSANIKMVLTRVVRGNLPPFGQMDSKGNPVRLVLGRGVSAFAPK